MNLNKKRGSRNYYTFGQPYEKYDKAVVKTGVNHYLGKGVKNHNGLGP
jgi:hypothetical protein